MIGRFELNGWKLGMVFALTAIFSAGGCLKLKSPAAQAPEKYMDMTDRLPLLDVKAATDPPPPFILEGKPYCFAGTNNYYLTYKSKRMVDDVLDRAKELDLDVIRIWGYLDIGSLDLSVRPVDNQWEKMGTKDGVYFRYWDTETNQPAINEGENGMPRLDYVLHAARQRGLKLLVVLTNNWKEFGGMDQYVVWHGAKYHHEFYTSDVIKASFKEWIKTIVLRTNSIDGVVYRDDPAIFSWELANEPRCRNSEEFDGHEGWDTNTMVTWADEMSRYIKELDPNHMVAVGDEGFLNEHGGQWAYNAYDGVDHEALSSVENIDFATFHLYPDNWGTGVKFGYEWIERHLAVAKRIGKPTMLEEYGTIVQRNEKTFEITWGWERRKTVYTNYHNLIREGGGASALFWMLGGVDDHHGRYPDYDHYIIYKGLPSADLIHDNAIKFKNSAPACKLAGDLGGNVPASPFVSAMRVPPKS